MLRTLASLALCTFCTPLWALCDGASYFDKLSPIQMAQLAAETNDIAFAHGTLWTAIRGDQTITLIGTMHIHDPRLSALRNQIRDTVQAADIILLEATPTEEAQVKAALAQNPNLIFIENGPTLPEMLDAASWERVMQAVRAQGIPPFLAAKFEPWYLMMTLAIPPCAMRDLAMGKRGLDHLIMEDASDAGVPLQALEPYDTLFNVFQNGGMQAQLEMLKASLIGAADQQSLFVAMLDSYFAGEIGRLIALTRVAAEATAGSDPTLARAMTLATEDAIIGTRNRAWMPVITAATAQHQNIVVAVGAAHLPDAQGLLTLLDGDGWAIAPF